MVAGFEGDADAYILSSKYRSQVVAYLAEDGPATPSEIADATAEPRPHVSRALAELREQGVVDLQVSESRNVGRYYDLTSNGREIWSRVKSDLRSVRWSIEEPTADGPREVLELARSTFDDDLRFVGLYDGDEFTVLYVSSVVLSRYTEAEREQGLRTLVFDHSIDEINMPKEDCWSETSHFDEFSLLRVRVDDGSVIYITFGSSRDVLIPTFAESVAATFDGRTDG